MSEVSGLVVARVLCRRALVRFTRQPARLVAAVGTPALLWAFLGSGFGESFRPAGLGETSYAAFLLPGAITLVAVFAAVFSSISLIEDRQAGWLQSVLVAPVPRWSIAVGTIAGGALVALVETALLLPTILVLDVAPGPGRLALVAIALAVTCTATSAMGLLFAWRSETVAGFHAVMNLVFMPLWLLSGAFFPADGAAGWLGHIMRLNPLAWCTSAIRAPLLGHDQGMSLPLAVAFAIVTIAAAAAVVSRQPRPS